MTRLTLLTLCALLAGCTLPWGKPLDSGSALHPVQDDAALHYLDEGPRDAPAVVLIHGFGSQLHIWDTVTPALEGFRVIRVDMLGFGDSSRVPGDYTPDAQADAILSLLDRLGVERAAVVGHSMGTVVAMTLAQRAPARVPRLVLLNPWVYEEQVPWSYRDVRRPGLGELIVGLWHTDQLAWRLEFSVHDPSLVTWELLEGARSHGSARGSRAAALATLRSLDLAERELRWGAVEQPVLVVAGREDRVSTLPFVERLDAQLPASRLEVLPYCGHIPMIEAPVATRRLLRYWLTREAW